MIKALTAEEQAGAPAKPAKPAPVSYEVFELSAQVARQIRNQLDDALVGLKADLDAVKAKHLKPLRTLSRALAARVVELNGLVDGNRDLFVKPRTTVLHEIKLGLAGGKGKLTFEDEQEVIRLIRKKLSAKKKVLIRTEHSVVKDALKNLPEDELSKIGCRIEGKGEDLVVVSFCDGEIEKAIDKLLGGVIAAMLEEGE